MKSFPLVIFLACSAMAAPQRRLPDNQINSQLGLNFQYRYRPRPEDTLVPFRPLKGPLASDQEIAERLEASADGADTLAAILSGPAAKDVAAVTAAASKVADARTIQGFDRTTELIGQLGAYLRSSAANVANVARAAEAAGLDVNTYGGATLGI